MRDPLANPKWTLPESTTLSRLTREALFEIGGVGFALLEAAFDGADLAGLRFEFAAGAFGFDAELGEGLAG